MRKTRVLVTLLLAVAFLDAQTRGTRTIVVTETTGIRRTEYPVGARVELAKGALTDLGHARLRNNDADAPAQFTAESRWEDGSVRALAVDFNVSIGPSESRTYQLEYGPDVAVAAPARGLAVSEEADTIQVGNVRFGKSGAPPILSANYVKSDFIGKGPNGLAIVDAAAGRHDLSTARDLHVELIKRGPLNVVVKYSGHVPVDTSYAVPVVVTFEMPNSKSWVKMTAAVEDPSRRVRTILYETPLAFGAHPWTWDFATENGTYGAFRNPTDTSVLTQIVPAKGAGSWTVQTGAPGDLRPYESSTAARSRAAGGWGHILDAQRAVAFAIDRFAKDPGTYTIALNGRGQATFSFAPAQSAAQHHLTVYQHFVSTPVPIGAATSPTAMLNPLRVEIRAP
jgi:hypothetical protein